jgi:hypothetical protein
MTFTQIIEAVAAVLVALGGGGAVVLGLSNYLGKLWADRLMARDRAEHETMLAGLRSEQEKKLAELRADLDARNSESIEQMKAALDLHKGKLAGAHDDKLTAYRAIIDLIVETVTDLHLGERLDRDKLKQLERARLRAYGYLALLAPQHAMTAFDRVVDYLLGVLEGSQGYDFRQLRELAIAMINEIRKDLNVDATPIAYLGDR